jgi:hypothetical protein
MAGEFLVGTGEGDVYSEEEARRWLQETGWRVLERKPLAVPPGKCDCGRDRTESWRLKAI